MEYKTFEKLYQKMVEEELKIGKTKALEYTRGKDRFDNFKRLGAELLLSPKIILWIYLKKHLDSILHYILHEEVLSEPIESRIKDARVYLALLRGLIEEGNNSGLR